MITGAPCNIETIDEYYSNGSPTKDVNQKVSNPDIIVRKSPSDKQIEKSNGPTPTVPDPNMNCSVVLNNLASPKSLTSKSLRKKKSVDKTTTEKVDAEIDTDPDGDGKMIEFEECESPLLPLYLLRDEGAVKWVLFSDLGYLLKLKSKEALLKQVSSVSVGRHAVNHLQNVIAFYLN